MSEFDATKVMQALRGVSPSLTADELTESESRLTGRSPDDHREASKIAVETAKLFIAIATAVLVAVGTFVQFARNGGVPWDSLVMYCFGAAALAVFASMAFGFVAISGIYQRADGRKEASKSAWSTEAVKGPLNVQGLTGIMSLILMVAGIVIWGHAISAPSAAVAIAIPGPNAGPNWKGPLTVEGAWTSLRLRTPGGQELTLPNQSQPISLTCN
jgi:hypothetical protein